MLFSPKNIAFGLDIGDKTIKLVELRRIKNLRGEEKLVLVSYNEAPLPDAVIDNGEIKNAPAVVAAIKKCIKGAKGKILGTRAVVASLPESQSYLKVVSLPALKKDNFSKADVERILDQHFPVEAEAMYFDWQQIGDGKIMIGASPKNIVDSFTNVIEQADLIPLSLEIESIALARALINAKEQNGGPPPLHPSSAEGSGRTQQGSAGQAKIFMDLGATRSAIIATYRDNPIIALNIPLSGEYMTQEIAKAEKIPFEKAEKLKLECGFDLKKCPVKTKKTIEEIFDSSVQQIETGLRYINRLLQMKTDKIFICGGVSAMPRITSVLSDGLKLKVRHADPSVNITISKKINLGTEDLLRYATAIGLAIRGTEQQVLAINE